MDPMGYGFTVVYPKNGTYAKLSWSLFMVGSHRSWTQYETNDGHPAGRH